jgi:transposase InsO family protein
LLNGEIFHSMKRLLVLAELWRVRYNNVRPHSTWGYRPPEPEAWLEQAETGYGKVESKNRFPLSHNPE